eukprot:3792977-Pleurochrysis_carterae.AAC.2
MQQSQISARVHIIHNLMRGCLQLPVTCCQLLVLQQPAPQDINMDDRPAKHLRTFLQQTSAHNRVQNDAFLKISMLSSRAMGLPASAGECRYVSCFHSQKSS